MRRDKLELLSAAASALSKVMITTCESAAADAPVTIPVSDFRKIATLLQQTGHALRADVGQLDDDGFRFWIPLRQLDIQRREVQKLRYQVNRLNAGSLADTFHF